MAAKQKKRGRGAAPSTGGSQEVERLIAKLQLKDAVHAAKLCYKDESTPEHHRLLERAYLLRCDQLRRGGMPAAAQEVAQHLLDFGVTDPALVEQAAALLMALGMTRAALTIQGRLDSPEAREALNRQEADLAVVHPERAAQVPPEVRAGAELVRGALAALHSGDDVSAIDALRDVARSSPWSDWKLFVRGLAAFSRNEADAVRANWDRLDPKRAAARIARGLTALSGNGATPNGPVRAVELEKQVFGEPTLDSLEELGRFVAENRWREALRRIAWLRPRLLRIDPSLAERLTSVLLKPLIDASEDLAGEEAEELLDGFTRSAQPLGIDPRWNRLRALACEGVTGELDLMEEHWRAYLADLLSVTVLTPEERRLAQALVWEHIGDQFMSETMPHPGLAGNWRRADEADRALRTRAIECFEQSVRLAPDYLGGYQALWNARRLAGQPDEAAADARRLLEKFPDDFATLSFLVNHHFNRQEPDPALEYVLRARAIKPLDPDLARQEFTVRVLRSRSLAQEARYDEGRADFSAAATACPEWSKSFHFKAVRAVFELKAGQTERGNALIVETQEELTEATPLWLALLIESIRYKLPLAHQERFDARWTKDQCRKIRSETAGALAELMTPFVEGDAKYEGRDAHVNQVVNYLLRGSRIKYRQTDLEAVVHFLCLVPQAESLRDKMVQRGMKLFPKAAWFPTIAGSLALDKSGHGGGSLLRAREYLQKALSLAEASKHPLDAKLLPRIRQSLSMIKDLFGGPMSSPFNAYDPRPFSSSGAPPEFFGLMDALEREFELGPCDDDEDGFGYDDDEPAPSVPASDRRSGPKPDPKPKAKAKAKPKPKKG
jgi:tetratricopeptide (TPR) repeat protein